MYTLAALVSWTEFWIEEYLWGMKKQKVPIIILGCLLVVGGQVF